MKEHRIYLDDIRTPVDPQWIVVRSYEEFIEKINEIGLETIEIISLDYDLGDSAMREYFTNVFPNYSLDYLNIDEKTGYDCAKWLVNHFYDKNEKWSNKPKDVKRTSAIQFPTVYIHSANPIGAANIMGYINNFFMNEAHPQTCIRVNIEHTV